MVGPVKARLRVWVALLTGNASLIGWAWAEGLWAESVAPMLCQMIATYIYWRDVDLLPDEDEYLHAVDLLAEVIAEHGPMECDPDCDCTACTGARFLTWVGR